MPERLPTDLELAAVGEKGLTARKPCAIFLAQLL